MTSHARLHVYFYTKASWNSTLFHRTYFHVLVLGFVAWSKWIYTHQLAGPYMIGTLVLIKLIEGVGEKIAAFTLKLNLILYENCRQLQNNHYFTHCSCFLPSLSSSDIFNNYSLIRRNRWYLKLDSHLPKIFYLLQWWPFKNDEKCFFFHLKSSFHSQDI